MPSRVFRVRASASSSIQATINTSPLPGAVVADTGEAHPITVGDLLICEACIQAALHDGRAVVGFPQQRGPAFKGEPHYAYWTADGEQPLLVPMATAVVQGTVMIISQAVTVSPTGEIVYDGNRYLTGTAPTAQGQAQIVVADADGQRRTQADFPVYIPPPEPENRAARRRRQRGR